uniref:ARAD1C14124p n=1 Tax=Blastobotrys adeninivorans TaxID=409370 RepID=A0A060T6H4_BLAAD
MTTPTAFDTSLSATDFQDSGCRAFFKSFLSNDTFTECYPMSFFLQNSQSYIKMVRSDGLQGVESLLSKSCGVDFDRCEQVMDSFLGNLKTQCKSDLKAQNSVVQAAQADFLAYPIVYKATCAKANVDHATASTVGEYCYSEALFSNSSSASYDSFLYLLPLGVSFPNTSTTSNTSNPASSSMGLSCSSCNKKLLQLYHNHTDHDGFIRDTYASAASVLDSSCGADFVPPSVLPLNDEQSGSVRLDSPLTLVMALLFVTCLVTM